MTTYTLAWGRDPQDPSGQNTIRVSTVEELDAALDRIAATGRTYLIDMYEGAWAKGEPTRPYGFQLVWGHPQRAAMTWLGKDAAIAVDASLPELPQPIGYDQGEAQPSDTRVTPTQVREALREYLRTGRRPTGVRWVEA
jgi:hypothetical protein